MHGSVSVEFPSHCFPPYWGVGLLHSLVRVRRAVPQEALQVEFGFQDDQPPSTVTVNGIKVFSILNMILFSVKINKVCLVV